MKRFWLLAAVSIIALMTGCYEGESRVTLKMTNPNPSPDQTQSTSILTLKNIHIHDSNGNDVPLLATATVNMDAVDAGETLNMCTLWLSQGEYHDLYAYVESYSVSLPGFSMTIPCNRDMTVTGRIILDESPVSIVWECDAGDLAAGGDDPIAVVVVSE